MWYSSSIAGTDATYAVEAYVSDRTHRQRVKLTSIFFGVDQFRGSAKERRVSLHLPLPLIEFSSYHQTEGEDALVGSSGARVKGAAPCELGEGFASDPTFTLSPPPSVRSLLVLSTVASSDACFSKSPSKPIQGVSNCSSTSFRLELVAVSAADIITVSSASFNRVRVVTRRSVGEEREDSRPRKEREGWGTKGRGKRGNKFSEVVRSIFARANIARVAQCENQATVHGNTFRWRKILESAAIGYRRKSDNDRQTTTTTLSPRTDSDNVPRTIIECGLRETVYWRPLD